MPMPSVLNTLSEYKYFNKSKNYFMHFCCLFLKLSEVFSVSLEIYLEDFRQKQPPEVFYKKLLLIISQYSQERTCVGVSF